MSELLDNSRARIEALKQIVHALHEGAEPASLTGEFGALLEEVGPSEIAAMESALMAEGMPQQEIQRMCDVHAAVLGSRMPGALPADVVPGHPLHTFRLANERLRAVAARYREVADALVGEASDATPAALAAAWGEAHAALATVEGHYLRKEYLVFPFLEQAGIAGPPKVMWGVHDEIRALLAAAGELLAAAGELDADARSVAVQTVLRPLLDQVESMTEKEDRILWPLAAQHLVQPQWEAVREQWNEFPAGPARPAGVWLPVAPGLPARPVEVPPGGAIRLPSGQLELRQLRALLDTLPVDITFVDAEGRVAYFSEGADRVFARNRAIVGRRVEDCHPPKSVHLVTQVVDELRSGSRDVAEFWIQMGGRFVHIRYFAVRDEGGEFLGTLEMTQDIAPLRALKGERRLLAESDGVREQTSHHRHTEDTERDSGHRHHEGGEQ